MESILKSDIFFFISSLSVILITVMVVIIGLRILPIIKDIKEFVQSFKKEGMQILKDVHTVHETVKEQGTIAKNALESITSFFGTKKKTRSKSKKDE